ncbi:MAG: JAB domain-containing protein [Bacteroidetes bacterium]|nr:MAG: JAB domain-containing protein [Bacteroidota bacterium]
MENRISIKQWAEDDRPREKMLLKGKQSLSNAELLAILIGSGNRKQSAVELAQSILNFADNKLSRLGKLSVNELKKFNGIGTAKAVTIAAALELGRRRKEENPEEKIPVTSSRHAYETVQPFLSDLPHEEFYVIYLNRKNEVIAVKNISKGGIAATVVDVRLILKNAIELLATQIILAHNHPSGKTDPSANDYQITRKIKEAAKLLDIQLLDHIIVGENTYYSFADHNDL